MLTEEINNIALIANDDKRTQSVDSMETDVYGTNEIKCISIIKQYKKFHKRKHKRI